MRMPADFLNYCVLNNVSLSPSAVRHGKNIILLIDHSRRYTKNKAIFLFKHDLSQVKEKGKHSKSPGYWNTEVMCFVLRMKICHHLLIWKSIEASGRVMAQVVSRLLHSARARIQSRTGAYWWKKEHWDGFFCVFQSWLASIISPVLSIHVRITTLYQKEKRAKPENLQTS